MGESEVLFCETLLAPLEELSDLIFISTNEDKFKFV